MGLPDEVVFRFGAMRGRLRAIRLAILSASLSRYILLVHWPMLLNKRGYRLNRVDLCPSIFGQLQLNNSEIVKNWHDPELWGLNQANLPVERVVRCFQSL